MQLAAYWSQQASEEEPPLCAPCLKDEGGDNGELELPSDSELIFTDREGEATEDSGPTSRSVGPTPLNAEVGDFSCNGNPELFIFGLHGVGDEEVSAATGFLYGNGKQQRSGGDHSSTAAHPAEEDDSDSDDDDARSPVQGRSDFDESEQDTTGDFGTLGWDDEGDSDAGIDGSTAAAAASS